LSIVYAHIYLQIISKKVDCKLVIFVLLCFVIFQYSTFTTLCTSTSYHSFFNRSWISWFLYV